MLKHLILPSLQTSSIPYPIYPTLQNHNDHQLILRSAHCAQMEKAEEYAATYYPGVMQTLIKYKVAVPFKEYKFAETTVSKVCSLSCWLEEKRYLDESVMQLVQQLISAVTSSAGTRVCSVVHSEIFSQSTWSE